ncbi:MAG: hypothetical protein LBP92_00775 [Deltaproteobacteria bacterium]|jgi:chaperonin cofactor prefoldin|nr:hypothetical protein [Deltaproteobacteria bacterium]
MSQYDPMINIQEVSPDNQPETPSPDNSPKNTARRNGSGNGIYTIGRSMDRLTDRLDRITEGIYELKGLYQGLDAKIDKVETNLEVKIDRVETNLNVKIDRVEANLNAKIDRVDANLNAKIDKVDANLNAKIDKVEANLNAKIDKVDNRVAIMENSTKYIEKSVENCQSTQKWILITIISGIILYMISPYLPH